MLSLTPAMSQPPTRHWRSCGRDGARVDQTLGIAGAHSMAMVTPREPSSGGRAAGDGPRVAPAYALSIGLAAAEVGLDLATWVQLDIATIYSLPLVVAAFTRNRRLLWGLMAALVLATFLAYALQIPTGAFAVREALFVNRTLDAAALLLTAGLVQVWMMSLDVREAQGRLLEEQNRKLEAANDLLVAHEAKIVRQNEELARRRHAAEEASGRKTQILNAVSHDIRNPANTINLMAEVIRRTAEDPSLVTQVPQMAKRLQSNAQSLVALVSEVLDVAQLDSGVVQLRESAFSLNEFVDTKRRDAAPLAEAKSLHLESETPDCIVCVRTDRTKLDRIVTNLVTNAIKFTASGSVTIGAALAADGAALVRIGDTGIGIAPHEIAGILDEFTQLDVPLAAHERGWGLGLAISRRLATVIGASIGVESHLGQGTVFTLRLRPECVVDIAPVALLGASYTAPAATDPAAAPSTTAGAVVNHHFH
jgi:signal transduction histidine kinase